MTAILTVSRFTPNLNAEVDEEFVEQWGKRTLNKARNILLRQLARGNGPSRAGQYPVTDTGRLAGGTAFEFNGFTGALGSNIAYAGYLQNGTRRMQARKLYNEAVEEAVAANIDELGEAVTFTK